MNRVSSSDCQLYEIIGSLSLAARKSCMFFWEKQKSCLFGEFYPLRRAVSQICVAFRVPVGIVTF